MSEIIPKKQAHQNIIMNMIKLNKQGKHTYQNIIMKVILK